MKECVNANERSFEEVLASHVRGLFAAREKLCIGNPMTLSQERFVGNGTVCSTSRNALKERLRGVVRENRR
jgi:hypothetical protein